MYRVHNVFSIYTYVKKSVKEKATKNAINITKNIEVNIDFCFIKGSWQIEAP